MRRWVLVVGLFAGVASCWYDVPPLASTDGSVNDTGSPDAPAGADAMPDGGWNVASTPGLVLWLEANQGVTAVEGGIERWKDQSAAGNDAFAVVDAGWEPSLAASSINALPAVHFHSTMNQHLIISDRPSLQWGTGDYYLALAARFSTSTTGLLEALYFKGFITIGGDAGSSYWMFAVNGLDAGSIVSGLSSIEVNGALSDLYVQASYQDATPRLYAVQRVSGVESLRVNGSQVASGPSSNDIGHAGYDVIIGSLIGYLEFFDGDIAELIGVEGALSVSDRTNLEAYLKAKYGL